MRHFALMAAFLMVMALAGPMACSGSGASAPGPNEDGDLDLPEIDPEPETLPDGDADIEPEPDLDPDPEPEPDLDPDPEEDAREFIEIESEPEREPDAACENGPDAKCFANAPQGATGTACVTQGGSQVLVFCEPSVPTPPTCADSTPQYSVQQVCEYGCIDTEKNGTAVCADPPDGDTDLEADPDVDAEPEVEEAPDGDLDTPDGDLDPEPEEEEEAPYVCQADGFELNEGQQSARAITPGVYDGLSLCEFDNDWFALELSAGDELVAGISFNGQRANLELYLLNGDLQQLDASNDPSASLEEVSAVATQAGTYYLYVFSANFGESDYTLSVDVIEGVDGDEETDMMETPEIEAEKEEIVTCADDAFEPNDDIAHAVAVTSIRYDDLALCGGQSDYYSIALSEGDTVTVDLYFLHYMGNIDLIVIQPDNTPLSVQSTTNNEHLTFTVVFEGTHYIRVFSPYFAFSRNDYDMEITITPSLSCDNDVFEPNGTQAEAAAPAPGLHQNLRLCPYDNDWFVFTLQPGESLRADVLFSMDDGDIDAKLYNSQGALLDLGDSRTDNEQLIHYNSGAEAVTVYLHVHTYGVQSLYYDLDIAIVQQPLCNDDIYEPNDSFAEASTTLVPGHYPDLPLCAFNEDWYRFSLQSGNFLTARAFFDSDVVPMQMFIWNAAQERVAFHRGIEGGLEIYTQAEQPADYILQVRAVQPIETRYTLDVSICAEDDYEPNDDYLESVYIEDGTGSFFNMGICRGNEDWFAVDILEGQTVSISLSFAWQEGDLDLVLRDGALNPVAQSTNTTDDEYIEYAPPTLGSFYIQVSGYKGDENTYDLIVNVRD